ncbi:Flp family type IVb pilin [Paraburkholderia phenazinium]|uniref:Pilus assembly protein Flp/PilA n=1 Tax=Paraburkholderia phenazinium TaxID=60549 RepID=A0A1G8HSL2_9BURK|nr:pilus assembly protein Flp/PilA [Paraburkholderia phenazinium]
MNTARSVSQLVASQPVAPTRFFRAIARLQVFLDDESGVTAIEYALLAALIAIVIVGAVAAAGTNLNTLFSDVAASV